MSIAVVAGNAAADPEIGLLAVLAGVPAGSPWCARPRVPFARADASLDALVRHLDYAVELVGPAHVGIATNHPFDVDDFNRELLDNAELFPDSYTRYGLIQFTPPEELHQVEHLPGCRRSRRLGTVAWPLAAVMMGECGCRFSSRAGKSSAAERGSRSATRSAGGSLSPMRTLGPWSTLSSWLS